MKFNFLNIVLSLVLVLTALIIAPFWKSILWGVILSIIFFPLKIYFQKFIKNNSLASLIVIFMMLIIILIPVAFLFVFSSSQVDLAINFIKSASKGYSDINIPYLGPVRNYLASINGEIINFFNKHALNIFSYTYNSITNLVFAFLIAFYLIKDGEKFLDYIGSFIKDKEIFMELRNTIKTSLKATLVGGFIIAFLQGFLCALGFLFVGIGGFFIWVIVGAIVSFVPVVGMALMWLPASVYFLLMGSYVKGIFLIIWGSLFVGSVDNYVRPLLIGTYMRIHPLLLFFGIMGGIVLFGFIGIFVGPIVISLADSILRVYKKEKIS